MTSLEQIMTGIIIAVISTIIGKIWGEGGKVSKSQCIERQTSCTNNMCTALESIKENQREMKEDVRIIKDQLFDLYGKKFGTNLG